MSAKHTPGPWTKADRLNGPWWHISGPQLANGGRQAVACVHGESKRGAKAFAEVFEANACLIAAAPELLAVALEALHVIRVIKPPENGNGTIVRLEDAILKATGEKA